MVLCSGNFPVEEEVELQAASQTEPQAESQAETQAETQVVEQRVDSEGSRAARDDGAIQLVRSGINHPEGKCEICICVQQL